MKTDMLWKVSTVTFFVLALHLGFIAFFHPIEKSTYLPDIDKIDNDQRPRFIIDTDVGSDDAVALLLALAAKDLVRVVAITCTYGNTNESNVETNVLKVLTIANRTDIPVYTGARLPLLQNYTAGNYFGQDGLGDFDFGRPVEGSIDRSHYAASVMVELTKRYPGQMNIVTLGPLTNLALAMSLDPNFMSNVARLYVMGGWFAKDTDPPGDPEVEFNFGQDPEADAIVLKAPIGPTNTPLITLMPNSLVIMKAISKKWRLEILGKLGTETMEFLNKAERPTLERLKVWESADAITLAIAIWPDLVLSELKARVAAITCHTFKGAVIADSTSPDKNVRIIRNFNVTGFKEKLLKYFG